MRPLSLAAHLLLRGHACLSFGAAQTLLCENWLSAAARREETTAASHAGREVAAQTTWPAPTRRHGWNKVTETIQ